ncbi:MAG: hypothetical protein WCH99_05045 [Verrucomicrobiota bacterium]
MKKPQSGFNLPAPAGQTKTMFYNEGNPAAVLVTSTAGRMKQSMMEFPNAEAALGWCRRNGSALYYMPFNLQMN